MKRGWRSGGVVVILFLIAIFSVGLWAITHNSRILSDTKRAELEIRIGAQTLRQDIRSRLSKEEICIKSVQNKSGFPIAEDGSVSAARDFALDLKLDDFHRVAQGSSLPRYGVRVDGLSLTQMTISGMGPAGGPLVVGEVILKARSLATDAKETEMKPGFEIPPLPVGKLFAEIDPQTKTIRTCFNGEDPRDLLVITCSQVGGVFNQVAGTCQPKPQAVVASSAACAIPGHEKMLASGLWKNDAKVAIDPKNDLLESRLPAAYLVGVAISDGPLFKSDLSENKKSKKKTSTKNASEAKLVSSKSHPGAIVTCQGTRSPASHRLVRKPLVYQKKCDVFCASGRLIEDNCKMIHLGVEPDAACSGNSVVFWEEPSDDKAEGGPRPAPTPPRILPPKKKKRAAT